jgi:hypothetical protein
MSEKLGIEQEGGERMSEKLGIDGKPLLHCAYCGQPYGYWQVFGFGYDLVIDYCVKCEERLILKEELEARK